MNSEELEQSLRSEFENYLKDIASEMRQSMSEYKQKFDADFEKHKEQLEQSMRELDEKLGTEKQLEASFTETVVEHLKLARDEGASITATAFAEAEEMEKKPEPPDFSALGSAIEDISAKDSQSEILKALVNHASEFTPRGAFFIVKNEHLVGWRVFGREDHEDPKVVREVFFPVDSNTALSEAVKALKIVEATHPDGEDDVMYRDKLGFGDPDRMFAVPLVARGRGVAVLYADSGQSGEDTNIPAIQSLMRVAGLTVEVLASTPHHVAPAHDSSAVAEQPVAEPVAEETVEDETTELYPEMEFDSPDAEEVSGSEAAREFVDAGTDEQPVSGFDAGGLVTGETEEAGEEDSYEFQPIETSESEFGTPGEPVVSEEASFEAPESYDDSISEYDSALEAEEVEVEQAETTEIKVEEGDSFEEAPSWEEPAPAESDSYEPDQSYSPDAEAADSTVSEFDTFESKSDEEFTIPVQDEEYDFETVSETTVESDFSFEAPVAEVEEMEPSFTETAEEPAGDAFAFEEEASFDAVPAVEEREAPVVEEEAPVVEEEAPVVEVEAAPVQQEEVSAPPVRSRFADRNLDLPIEVAENERRLHNDARRFARLLVSEIKLYNEQKVKEGRDSSDLYERLREAIDRSREMYDKRVQPPVAAKFDYFNYELVNTLAEGDEGKLGGSYPGPAI